MAVFTHLSFFSCSLLYPQLQNTVSRSLATLDYTCGHSVRSLSSAHHFAEVQLRIKLETVASCTATSAMSLENRTPRSSVCAMQLPFACIAHPYTKARGTDAYLARKHTQPDQRAKEIPLHLQQRKWEHNFTRPVTTRPRVTRGIAQSCPAGNRQWSTVQIYRIDHPHCELIPHNTRTENWKYHVALER